jgi:hypothetical protein
MEIEVVRDARRQRLGIALRAGGQRRDERTQEHESTGHREWS